MGKIYIGAQKLMEDTQFVDPFAKGEAGIQCGEGLIQQGALGEKGYPNYTFDAETGKYSTSGELLGVGEGGCYVAYNNTLTVSRVAPPRVVFHRYTSYRPMVYKGQFSYKAKKMYVGVGDGSYETEKTTTHVQQGFQKSALGNTYKYLGTSYEFDSKTGLYKVDFQKTENLQESTWYYYMQNVEETGIHTSDRMLEIGWPQAPYVAFINEFTSALKHQAKSVKKIYVGAPGIIFRDTYVINPDGYLSKESIHYNELKSKAVGTSYSLDSDTGIYRVNQKSTGVPVGSTIYYQAVDTNTNGTYSSKNLIVWAPHQQGFKQKIVYNATQSIGGSKAHEIKIV